MPLSYCKLINIITSDIQSNPKLESVLDGSKIFKLEDNSFYENKNRIINDGIKEIKGINNVYLSDLSESYSTFKYYCVEQNI